MIWILYSKIEQGKNHRALIKIKKVYLVIFQVIFWLGYIIFVTAIFAYVYEINIALEQAIMNAISLAIVIYINLWILIPYLLEKKKFWLYGFAGILIICLLAYVRIHYSQLSLNVPLLLRENITPLEPIRLFATIFLPFLGAFFVSLSFKLAEGWLQNLTTQATQKSQQLEAELKFLRTQINPHFLFNTLNNIYTLCLLKEDNAAPMVMKLSHMMRYMLYECRENKVDLKKEIEFLENYIELQKIKSDTEQNITFKVSGNLNHLKIAPLILLSFVENCFKHGNIDSDQNAWVIIDIQAFKNILHINIANSIGDYTRKKVADSGIGLQNTQRRLELIYPQEHTLKIDAHNQEFKINLTLELE